MKRIVAFVSEVLSRPGKGDGNGAQFRRFQRRLYELKDRTDDFVCEIGKLENLTDRFSKNVWISVREATDGVRFERVLRCQDLSRSIHQQYPVVSAIGQSDE